MAMAACPVKYVDIKVKIEMRRHEPPEALKKTSLTFTIEHLELHQLVDSPVIDLLFLN